MVKASVGFDSYLNNIPEKVSSLAFSETVRVTINGFPESFDKNIFTLAHTHGLKAYIIEECLVSYGLNRLFYEEISSFGLEKKVNILDKMMRHIQIPASKKDKLEIIHENCSVCRKKISLSEQSRSLIASVGSLLDMGISDILMLCIVISLNESEFVLKEFHWFRKEFYLEREKKGFKVLKSKSLLIRSKLKIYKKQLDQLYKSYVFRSLIEEKDNNIISKLSDEDLKDIGILTSDEKRELKLIVELRREMHDLKLDR